MMKTFFIRLYTIQDVRDFVNAVSLASCDIDLTSGRYVVDAKSIMGIFSLDLLSPIQVTIHGECAGIEDKLERFMVKD